MGKFARFLIVGHTPRGRLVCSRMSLVFNMLVILHMLGRPSDGGLLLSLLDTFMVLPLLLMDIDLTPRMYSSNNQ